MPGMYEVMERVSQNDPNKAWLRDFTTPIDDVIAEILRKIDTTPLQYDPCAFDALLLSAADRLDACLMRRRDILDLLDRAVRQNLDSSLFLNLREQDDILDAASSIQTQSLELKKFSEAAAAAFNGSGPLSNGFENISKGTAAVADVSSQQDAKRATALKNRASVLREHQKTLVDFSVTPGHPINYEHRVKRVMTMFVDDLNEAYGKLTAVAVGMKNVLGIDRPLPQIKDSTQTIVRSKSKPETWEPSNALDALVIWARETARLFEMYGAREIPVVIQLPLVQKYSFNGIADPGTILPKPEDFANSFGNAADDNGDGLFVIPLDASHFPRMKNLRLVGIGVSIVPENSAKYKEAELTSCRVMVDAPDREEKEEYKDNPKRSMLIGVTTREFAPIFSCDAIRNANPIGSWRVRVLRGVLGFGAAELKRKDQIKDLRLCLKVMGTISQGAGE